MAKGNGGRPGRAYTPEERRAIERRRRAERERRRRRDHTVIAVIAMCLVVVGALCVWYFGSVEPSDNYDAQMSIGVESFKAGKLKKAEGSFLNALAKKPNDPEAMIALSDTYAAEGRYEDAIRSMKALRGIDDMDVRAYERIITWSVEVLDMATANEQIADAYARHLTLNNDLIRPAPVFDPPPGDYDKATKVSMKSESGLTIYYSSDGSVPTPQDGNEYKKKISLKNNNEVTYTAAAYDKYGLMSWPASARYSLRVKYGVDASAAQYLGHTAEEIMDAVGPLYYSSSDEGGYYYHDENKVCYYVFSGEYFMVEKITTDGAVEISAIDPEEEPLPTEARCVAVSMRAADYIVKMNGGIGADDFPGGIGVEEYEIDRSELDGKYHLIYGIDGARYDITLKDKDTISKKSVVMIYAG
jgi:hypothetical protein